MIFYKPLDKDTDDLLHAEITRVFKLYYDANHKWEKTGNPRSGTRACLSLRLLHDMCLARQQTIRSVMRKRGLKKRVVRHKKKRADAADAK
jgi:hypothetical protein